MELCFQNVSLRKTKSGSSLLSKDRNSSSLDLVRPLEFHCIQFRFLIIGGVVFVPARVFKDGVSAAKRVIKLG